MGIYTNHVAKMADAKSGLSSARVAVLRALRELGGSRTVKELAEELGQHPNTVREHLDALVDGDFVLSTSSKPEGRGRPAIKYRANPARGARERAYVDLANELARMVDSLSETPDQAAIQAGRAWGARMIESDPEAVTEGIRPWLAHHGWSPIDGDERRIVMERCPVVECARHRASVVCSMHLGVLMEYAAHTGIAQNVKLTPHLDDRYCLLELGDPLDFSTSA